MTIPRLVIAAPASGSGKSTLAVGLMAALAQEKTVQGFKVGPDYIDPGYHSAACGRTSRNLDTWMTDANTVLASFARAAAGADVAIIEGVMGLFDGYSGGAGSTAEIARLLGAPVVLVLDVGKMAQSAGAIALGLRDFDPLVNIAGVICNNVGSERHAAYVTEAIQGIGLPLLGCLPRVAGLKIPERHLGLQTAIERGAELDAFLALAADLVRQHIDLPAVWKAAQSAAPLPDVPPLVIPPPKVRIGVAWDAAFCFYYADNFDLLRAVGAELLFFSPLHDPTPPAGIDGLYFGGGYPELYAAELAANAPMLAAIRDMARRGLPVYAECGGLMYLTEGITTLGGQHYPLLGFVQGTARLRDKMVLGYREVSAQRDTILLSAGESIRGHEFHYYDWFDHPADLPAAYWITPRKQGEAPRAEGVASGNVLASFVHLHFGANPRAAARFVQSCR